MNPSFKLALSGVLLILGLLYLIGTKTETAITDNSRLEEPIFNFVHGKNSSFNYQDTLFTALKVLKTEGRIEQLETAKSFVLVSIKSDSEKTTVIRAYTYSGELLWEKNYDSEHARIAVYDDSDVVVIIEPIVKDDPYDTSLRDCKHLVFNKSGEELSKFQNPCFTVSPMGTFGYLAINTKGIHSSTSIYDFRINEFKDYEEPVYMTSSLKTAPI